MVTDPIADMLTRIRNGCRAKLERVDVPLSKLKEKMAEIMKREGFIADFRPIATGKGGQATLEVKLKYDEAGEPVIADLQRISKCGLRKYYRSKDIPRLRNGLGVLLLSTSQGVMTDRDARKANVGGEPLCAIW